MKISGKVLALCALNACATTAFMVGPPSSPAFHTKLAAETGVGSEVTIAPSRGPVRGDLASGPTKLSESIMAKKGAFDSSSEIKVQGGSLRTWSFTEATVERVQVLLTTEGRPMNANVDLWQGPDNTPQKMQVYIEDGCERPFKAVIQTPRGSNSVAIRNTAGLEFPLGASVEADNGAGLEAVAKSLSNASRTIQGGAVHTYPFNPAVKSVQVLLKTDGRPLNARIELLQGPNNIKQVVELYTEDGMERPFFAVIETPGTGNVVRIVNTATMEYPLIASVEPFMVDE